MRASRIRIFSKQLTVRPALISRRSLTLRGREWRRLLQNCCRLNQKPRRQNPKISLTRASWASWKRKDCTKREFLGETTSERSLTAFEMTDEERLPCHFEQRDRKSTRLNSSHLVISYA